MSGEHDRYPSLRITGLGNFAIEYLAARATAADNEPQYSSVAEDVWRGRKQAQTVLKVLLCRPHRRASREVLQEAIWPQGKGDSAETAFNAIISVLRHVLSLPITQKPLLTITRVDEQTIYQLAPQALIWMDADEAESLLIQAEQARRDSEDPLPLLEQAYRFFGQGPFLAEDDGAWVQQRKWHMDEAAHRCTHWLVDLYEERDLFRQATTVLSTLFESDPTDEDILCRLMRLLVKQERRREALRCYQRAERALQEEEMEPTPAIKKLAERIRNEAILIEQPSQFQVASTLTEMDITGIIKSRRQLLQDMLTSAYAILVLPPQELFHLDNFERIAVAIAEPSKIDKTALLSLETITKSYWKLRANQTSHDLLQAIVGHFRYVIQILKSSQPIAIKRTLYSIASETAQIIGQMLFDMHEYAAAWSYYTFSLNTAQNASNSNLQAACLGRISLLLMHNNQPMDALIFLQDAQQLTTQSDTTIICSWLAAIKAEIYAYLHDTQAAVKAINRSEYIVAQSASGEDTYATGFNLSRLSGYKGSCFVQLHQPEAALQALNEALRLLDPSAIRRKSTILTDIAVAYTQLDGGVIKACELANQALEITLQTKSLSVLQRIRALRRKLEPWEFTTEVKELDDFLTTTFTAINS